jgi:omega-6 fatty acid desaturase (delta-12 desaturase)
MSNSDINNNSTSSWMEIVSKYNFSNPIKSWWQVINSVIPYLLLWVVMIWSLHISYWITLVLSLVAAGFLIRILSFSMIADTDFF